MLHYREQGLNMVDPEPDDWADQEAMLGLFLSPEALRMDEAVETEQKRLSADRERRFHRAQPNYDPCED